MTIVLGMHKTFSDKISYIYSVKIRERYIGHEGKQYSVYRGPGQAPSHLLWPATGMISGHVSSPLQSWLLYQLSVNWHRILNAL